MQSHLMYCGQYISTAFLNDDEPMTTRLDRATYEPLGPKINELVYRSNSEFVPYRLGQVYTQ